MRNSKRKLLLASIHDVSPGFERDVDLLAEQLARRLGDARFAMLVVPNYWGQHPIRAGTPFASRLRTWSEQGVEMFVHGWFHKDTSQHDGFANVKAQHFTAGEGEFLGLAQDEAARLMRDGRALIEDIIGREVAGFIAPAWLYGDGAKAALEDVRFKLAEDHMRVWSPQTGEALARGPVITWASRSPARTASSLAFAALARQCLHPLDVVRIAVHPGDTSKPSILRSIDRTLTAFASRRDVGRYGDLLC